MWPLLKSFLPSSRRGRADLEQAAWFSPLVIDGQRPRWLYRTDPIDDADSGWAFFEGSETDAWLNEEGHCVMQHLGHILERWPELEPVLADERTRSAWDWDADAERYVEVRRWHRLD